jgi:hypothetical protein
MVIRRRADTISRVYPDLRGLHVRREIQEATAAQGFHAFRIFFSTSLSTDEILDDPERYQEIQSIRLTLP